MSSTASSGNAGEDPREFASGKVLAVLGVPAEGGETLGFWIEAYLTTAVRGVRSPEVAGKIARHLGRFRDWTVSAQHPGCGQVKAEPAGTRGGGIGITSAGAQSAGVVEVPSPAAGGSGCTGGVGVAAARTIGSYAAGRRFPDRGQAAEPWPRP